jgi:hypothetical protein
MAAQKTAWGVVNRNALGWRDQWLHDGAGIHLDTPAQQGSSG